MMQNPYSLDIDMKYKRDQYLHEAVNERLLREICALHDGKSSKRRLWIRIQIVIKVIFQTRESQRQQISSRGEVPSPLETSVRHL